MPQESIFSECLLLFALLEINFLDPLSKYILFSVSHSLIVVRRMRFFEENFCFRGYIGLYFSC